MSGEPNAIDAPGTPEDAWRAWDGLAALPALDFSAWRSVAVVAAHPDDEVLGAGGLLAMLGVPVRLIAVTDGEGSHPHEPPAAIAARRTAETAAALARLGDVEVVRLGMPDTAVRDDALAPELRALAAGHDVLLAPWEHDVHADHEAAGRAALACADVVGEVLRFPIWTWHWARPGDPRVPWDRALRVPLTADAAERKRAAIGCFESQLGTILPPETVAHFTRPYEVVIR
ncbi:PIG-L deacetylase family protein [Actinomadura parmotrematis]|uniref:PIG-L family deacetylase n=1 Tax=Actinomadura parmotrematis TaxID=2864039 RepID=A0ABS7FPV9_9ACTN|nr:PIG-L family deacetylase [Actinomadura parmotrematis]MBW8482435.1 PIG-L family deacetylase [Actinomadura parmotrematis]